MSTVSPINKAFTSSELILLQKLYRSRDFKSKRNAQITKNEIRFLIYGSRNTLSSAQRTAFRQYIAKANSIGLPIKVKISLFSGSVSKTTMNFSSLTCLKNVFKGTTYELELTFNDIDAINVYTKRLSFVSYLNKLQFNEDTKFNFSPSLIRIVSKTGEATPMRFDIKSAFIGTTTNQVNHVISQLVSQLQSVANQLI